MSGFAFDANILIDALAGFQPAHDLILEAVESHDRAWISRMAWIEVLSKGSGKSLLDAEAFLSGFSIDEVDEQTASRAAALRRERSRLRSPDAIILASAMVRGRTLVTRNTKDFRADMPGILVPYIL